MIREKYENSGTAAVGHDYVGKTGHRPIVYIAASRNDGKDGFRVKHGMTPHQIAARAYLLRGKQK